MKKIMMYVFIVLGCMLVNLGAAPVKPGSTVVFYGDSITSGGLFPFYVQAAYLTHFPKCDISWHNRGISGSNVTNSLQRLDKEVISLNPDVVFIMMGMNDINITLYKVADSNRDQRMERLNTYEKSYRETVRILKEKTKARIILMTPTPYDQYSIKGAANLASANEGLAAAAEIVRRVAADNQLELVEVHQPYTEILKKFPNRGINRPDRVHPEPLGHLLATMEILSAQELPVEAGNIVMDAKDKAAGLKWQYTPARLPFPVTAETAAADEMFNFTEKINREILTVKNLPSGNYDLLADGRKIGTWSNAELGEGVNIAPLDTPQQRIAQKILQQIMEGRKLIQEERNVAATEFFSMVQGNIDPADYEAMDKYNTGKLASQPANSYGWHVYNVYKKYRGKDGELRAQAEKHYRAAAELAVLPAVELELRPAVSVTALASGDKSPAEMISVPQLREVSGQVGILIPAGAKIPRINLFEKRNPQNEFHLFLAPAGNHYKINFFVWGGDGKILFSKELGQLLAVNQSYDISFELTEDSALIRLDEVNLLQEKFSTPRVMTNSKVKIGGTPEVISKFALYQGYLPQ